MQKPQRGGPKTGDAEVPQSVNVTELNWTNVMRGIELPHRAAPLGLVFHLSSLTQGGAALALG
jgi:hypothetical protein